MKNRAEGTTGGVLNWIIAICILAGLLLITTSLALPDSKGWEYLRDILKELGIVIFAVFTVSLLYEVTVAERYLAKFLSLLRDQVEQGESNASACVRLGIVQIFPTRDTFEMHYPIRNWVSTMDNDSALRIVAKSLFLTMGKPDIFKNSLTKGARVELCLFNPGSDPSEVAKSFDLELHDIRASISVFRRELAVWLAEAKPQGSLELRFHDVPLNDSYLQLRSPIHRVCVWDISFGRDVSKKRIMLLDPDKELGGDLSLRYGRIWNEARVVYSYSAGAVAVDHLSAAGGESSSPAVSSERRTEANPGAAPDG